MGVSHSPNPADIEFDWQVNGTEDKANPKETFLLHVLPILGTVVGSTVLIVVVTISWYCLTVLRKKSRCVGVTVERNSSHTELVCTMPVKQGPIFLIKDACWRLTLYTFVLFSVHFHS